ncbi:glutathione S-transferase [Sandaracinobacter neustonicus]|uniref:Glutathione S-transferase n=1 Tax=Sandaracinobacter neustonicus TaxID=1715348 RepID=A0A501XMH3_9SPHN|nr:glutathione S-transferase [Sandaracinobacter neustonicus]TPE61766.1 glutathione S-transferase [Sandaracinobacter neustonicus]
MSIGPTDAGLYQLHGALGSPYSMKMRALMRYRRLPFIWVQDHDARTRLFAQVKAPVIPLLRFPDGAVANDSTLLTRELEALYPGRGVLPDDPAQAFLAFLIEDFADEWLTKAMFGYRWLFEPDQQQMSAWLMYDAMPGVGAAAQGAMAAQFRDRQVGRMPLVGCTAANFALIEASTRRVLAALERHTPDGLFLFGSRPSEAEFALYGQLLQLATDPTPAAILRSDYPLALRWLSHIDDLSGVDGEWGAAGALVAELLPVIGEVYLPFLAANAAAVEQGAADMRFEAMGHRFAQPPFRYQAKCLHALQAAWAALAPDDAARVRPQLAESGCLPFLETRA